MTSLAYEECHSIDSSDESLEELAELESNLYSMIHYNNLSEIVASDLPEGFTIDVNKSSNEIIVSLAEDEIDSGNSSNTDKNDCNQQSVTDTCINTNDNSIKNKAFSERIMNSTEKKSDDSNASNQIRSSTDSDVEVIDVMQNKLPKSTLDASADKIEDECNEINGSSNTTCKSDNSLDCSSHSKNHNTECNTDRSNKTTSIHIEEIIISSEEDCAKHENKNNKNKRRRVKTKKSGKRLTMLCPKKWNTSMIKFYSKISRSKLEFDSTKLIKKMRETLDRNQWFVGPKDYDRSYDRSRKFRCRRCRQFGHEVRDCSEPYKPLTCHMCGDIGHRENRCPQRKCLTCGRSSSVFVQMCSSCTNSIWKGNLSCNICHSVTHSPDLCPDVWRGLHMTTNGDTLIMPPRQNLKRICCNCGTEGHMDFECSEVNNSIYVISDPTIRNYISIAQVFAAKKDNLSMRLTLNSQDSGSLSSNDGLDFLQNLSNKSQARLELEVEPVGSLTVIGSDHQCKTAVDSVRTFLENNLQQNVPFHKHKKKLHVSKKRRTV